MSMSDDEDEDDEEEEEEAEEEIVDSQVTLETVSESHDEEALRERDADDVDVDLANAMYEENRFSDSQALVVSIDAAALTLFELTPRTSTHAFAWTPSLIDPPQPTHTSKNASRTTLRAGDINAVPRSKSAMSHTSHISHTSHTSRNSYTTTSHRTARNSSSGARAENPRSVSQSHGEMKQRESKRHRSTQHPPRLSLNLEPGWAPVEVEVNFIDLLDEQQEDANSGSDSWRSIFEVSCSA